MQNLSPILVLILLVLSFGLSIFSIWQTYTFKKWKKAFFSGSTPLSLENVIMALRDNQQDIINQQEALEKALINLKQESQFMVQKVGLVRFNPFDDGGGNFSFSLALLDAYNTGFILTSMYGRQQNRVYTKKIENGKSESQLTDEELQAFNEANSKR